jgi:hypothetical protein
VWQVGYRKAIASDDHGDKEKNSRRTVNAPGTDTMTTFLCLHSAVESLVAKIWFDSLDLSLKEYDGRTDSAGRLEQGQ